MYVSMVKLSGTGTGVTKLMIWGGSVNTTSVFVKLLVMSTVNSGFLLVAITPEHAVTKMGTFLEVNILDELRT